MVTRRVLWAVLATTLMAASLRGDEPAEGFNGRWVVTTLVLDGIETDTFPNPFWLDIADDAWSHSFVVGGMRVTARFKVTLAESDTEILVDAQLLDGFFKGGVCKGICRVNGDTMRLCLADKPTTNRPTRFECPKGSGLHLMELRRSEEPPMPP